MILSARSLRWLGITAVMVSYAILANYTNQSSHNQPLGALLALAPVALTSTLLAWRSKHRLIGLVLVIFAAATTVWLWPLLKQHYGWIYWLEHETLQLILFMTFARTLVAGRQPLCTQFAQILQDAPLSPAHARYAYRVTVAWTVFFASMIVISMSLFFMCPIGIWSIFSNFVFLPLVMLMFIGEFLIRKWALPDVAHTDMMAAVRTYLNNTGHHNTGHRH